MTASTLDRLERLLAMVPWLLANPGARLDEVAARFDTTAEAVAADLDVLGYCGVPGYGGGDLVEVCLAGDAITVRMAEYFRRPLRLRHDEAVALLLAGRSVAAVPGLGSAPALRRAVGRLEQALGADGEAAVDLTAPGDELLADLAAAVERGRVVRLHYRSATDETERPRDIEPWALLVAHGRWYLRGRCRRADAPRDLRVDRMRSVAVTDEPCAVPPSPPTHPPRYRASADDLRVVVDLEPAAWWTLDALPVEAVEDRGATRRVHVPARSAEWAARWVLGLAGTARVVEPEEVRQRVAELAAEQLAALEEVSEG